MTCETRTPNGQEAGIFVDPSFYGKAEAISLIDAPSSDTVSYPSSEPAPSRLEEASRRLTEASEAMEILARKPEPLVLKLVGWHVDSLLDQARGSFRSAMTEAGVAL